MDLVEKRGVINFDIASLRFCAAAVLSNFQGEQVCFNNALPNLDSVCAKLLLKLGDEGRLSIAWLRAKDHLPSLDQSTFLAFTKYADSVDMEGYGNINTREAEILSQFQGTQILVYVDTMNEDIAKQLSMAKTDLLMVSVKDLEPLIASALSASKAQNELQMIVENDTIDPESATALSQYHGNTLKVQFKGLPSAETMQQLAQFIRNLVVCMPVITPEIAMVLAKSKGTLELWLDEKPKADVIQTLSGSEREVTNLDSVFS